MVAISVVSAMDVKSGIYVGSGITKGPTLKTKAIFYPDKILVSQLLWEI
jgi:hypothetical protein